MIQMHRLITAGLLIVGATMRPAGASDAALSRALIEAQCSPVSVSKVHEEKGIATYAVTCLGSPVRKLAVLCADERCSTSTRRTGDEPAPDGNSRR